MSINGFWKRITGHVEAPVEKAPEEKKRSPMQISELARARTTLAGHADAKPFRIPPPPPGVVPNDAPTVAQDSSIESATGWAAGYGNGGYGYAFTEGLAFLGYPYLAELAQRPEYRRIVEIIATEATRKWIRITTKGDDDKSEKVSKIKDEMDRLNCREVFKTISEQDGFFGRSHLYIDTGATDDPMELKTSIGDGLNEISKIKVTPKKPIMALRPVEAVWTYPTSYNSNDPLKGDWYKPDIWFVMGKQVHVSRLLTFIGRPVPDLLKPAYSFGGLALTQMAKPYVDNWLQTRQSVNDLISAFSVMVLSTNMSSVLGGGGAEQELARATLFTNMRNNRGLFMVDKDNEDFKNVSAPLGTLDMLQAQSQEQQAAVSGIPLVKLLGIQPAGLNASSEGEIRVFYDTISAYQEAFLRDGITTVLGFIQLSLFGDVDEDIIFQFEPLYALNEKEHAEVRKFEAETAQILIDSGVITPEEERERLASDPETMYQNIDPSEVPDLLEEEDEGLEPATREAFDALFAGDGDWKEGDHPRDADGKFGSGGGSSAGSKESVSKGSEAMSTAIAEHRDVMGAMERPEIGPIDFRWGDKAGGVAHIVDKHGEEAARKMPEVIANGQLTAGLTSRGRPRVEIKYQGWVAYLAPEYHGEAGHWLVTGFERVDKKEAR